MALDDTGMFFLTLSSVGAEPLNRQGAPSKNAFKVNLGREISLKGSQSDYEVALAQVRYGADSPLNAEDVFVYTSLADYGSLVNGVSTNLVKILLNQSGTLFAHEESSSLIQWRPLATTVFSEVEVEVRLGGADIPSTGVETLVVLAVRHQRRS